MPEKPQRSFIEQATKDGLVKFTEESKAERIHYIAADLMTKRKTRKLSTSQNKNSD
jgi:hypothetical protein